MFKWHELFMQYYYMLPHKSIIKSSCHNGATHSYINIAMRWLHMLSHFDSVEIL